MKLFQTIITTSFLLVLALTKEAEINVDIDLYKQNNFSKSITLLEDKDALTKTIINNEKDFGVVYRKKSGLESII